jgi:hypothetical protein
VYAVDVGQQLLTAAHQHIAILGCAFNLRFDATSPVLPTYL